MHTQWGKLCHLDKDFMRKRMLVKIKIKVTLDLQFQTALFDSFSKDRCI